MCKELTHIKQFDSYCNPHHTKTTYFIKGSYYIVRFNVLCLWDNTYISTRRKGNYDGAFSLLGAYFSHGADANRF